MPLVASRVYREVAIPVANGASQSNMVNLENAIAGSYVVPSPFTNTGATNLGRWGVSNNYDDPAGTALIALLSDTTLAAAQTQRHTATVRYPIPADVLKFRSARFDGVAAEAGARVLTLTLLEGYVTWRRVDVTVPSDGSQASEWIPTYGARGGSLLIPSAFTSTSIGWNVGDGGAWESLRLPADTLYAHTVAVDRWIPIPDAVFAFPYFRISTASNEAAARVIRIDLKVVG
jgi:hypothetical protein